MFALTLRTYYWKKIQNLHCSHSNFHILQKICLPVVHSVMSLICFFWEREYKHAKQYLTQKGHRAIM